MLNDLKLIRLAGGDKNLVYRLDGLDLVLRVYQPSTAQDGVAFAHSFQTLLSEQMDCVSRPLASFQWQGRPVSIEPYIHGTAPTMEECADLCFCCMAGETLGQLHAIAAQSISQLPPLPSRLPLKKMNPLRNYLYDWDTAAAWLSGTQFAPELPYIIEQLPGLWGSIARLNLPLIPIHGDYYAGNLLWDGKKITGVVDFDDSRLEWAQYEIARSLWEFTRDDAAFVLDPRRRDAYLEGYSSANPGIAHDLGLYMKFIKLIRLIEILSTATSQVRGDLLGDFDMDYHWTNLLWCKEGKCL